MRSTQALLTVLMIMTSLPSYAQFEAHEWGTFTSLVGSNGVTQNGMYHEDEHLPGFVHGFGELRTETPPLITPPSNPRPPCRGKGCFDLNFLEQNIVTQKMETPVIYFYTDTPVKVDVNVKFPEGVITETYPGPVKTYPTKQNINVIAGGDTTFSVEVSNRTVDIVNGPPHVDSQNIYGHARNVNSNIITSGAETEKFIFYRGIGRFQPRIDISSQAGNINLTARKQDTPQAAFLVYSGSKGEGRMMKVNFINAFDSSAYITAQNIKKLKNPSVNDPSIVSGQQAHGMLVDALIASGLFKDEANAMVNTWENGYFKVPGLRLLYILPRHEVDQILPLTMNPMPSLLVRSFVGRIEILTDSEEQRIIEQVEVLRSNFQVSSLGRFAEPMLRRVAQVYSERPAVDPRIMTLLQDLIQQAAKADTKEAVLN